MNIKLQASTSALIKKMLAIREAVGLIEKKGVNVHQHYHYVTEADVSKIFTPLLNKYRVFLFTSVLDRSIEPKNSGSLTTVKLQVTFVDADTGEQYSCIFYGDGWDKGDKGVFKAITGALKYALMKTFLVATGDDPEQDDFHTEVTSRIPSIPTNSPPPSYGKLKVQAELGEDALRNAWNALALQDKRQLWPYRKALKQIAKQASKSGQDLKDDTQG